MPKQRNVLLVSLIAMFAVTSVRADIASTQYVDDSIPSDVSAFNNDAGYLVSSDISGLVDTVNSVTDVENDNSLTNRVAAVEAALGENGKTDAGKAIIAGGSSLGTPTYRVIDTTAGGTTGSDSLITSGAVYSGLAGKQATIDSSHKLSKDLVSGLGTAAAANTSDFATSTQGGKADSAIQSVKVNGAALTPDGNKAVDVTVPTKVSDLTNDANYITASQVASGQVQADWTEADDSDPAYIANKPSLATVATSGSYTDLLNKPTIDSALSSTSENAVQNKVVNTALAGKQATIDSSHKLNADLVDDSTTTNKFVTASEKTTWSGKANASHTHSSGDVTAMTGYAKADSATAISAGDSLNAAIGKLEKALDGKQATITAGTYDAYGAAAAVENKLDDGASGYDINAKSLKVQGADVLTSHQTLPTVTTSSGSGNMVTSVTQTNGAIAVTKSQVQIPVGNENADTYASIWVE